MHAFVNPASFSFCGRFAQIAPCPTRMLLVAREFQTWSSIFFNHRKIKDEAKKREEENLKKREEECKRKQELKHKTTIIVCDPVLYLFREADTAAKEANNLQILEERWKKNPERVRRLLKTYLAPALFYKHPFYSFSTNALRWAKSKDALDLPAIVKEMSSQPQLSFFNQDTTKQMVQLFPQFVHPPAVYRLLDDQTNVRELFHGKPPSVDTCRYYFSIFEKDPRDKRGTKTHFTQHVINYLACYGHCVTFLDEFFEAHPDILTAYIARGVEDGKTLQGTRVPFYINDAESRQQRLGPKDES